MQRLAVEGYTFGSPFPKERAAWCCRKLEEGNILFFPQTPFEFKRDDLRFLLSQKQTEGQYHKNIAYRPRQDRVTGFADPSHEARLLEAMRDYSKNVVCTIADLLFPYWWRLDYASFRPLQEKGRDLRTRARNDLLHVDSFPTRPTNGDRILRFFTNISPQEPRRWVTTEGFAALLERFQENPAAGLGAERASQRVKRALLAPLKRIGLPVTVRSAYDEFMLSFHHFLKENRRFQEECPKDFWEFPPGTSWIVYTDLVPHAVLSGQYALEQTLIVSRDSMLHPELAPVAVWEAARRS